MKPLVFISHIHTEADIAVWLKDQLTQLLLGAVEFFVSSDKTSIIAGDRWLRNIEDGVKRASVVIVLCSEKSIERPWINFEAGGAWFSGKRVIPLCHGNFFPSSLPEPLKSLQGLSLNNPQDLQDLIALLATEAGLLTPQVNTNEMLSTLRKITNSESKAPPADAAPVPPTAHSLDELFKALQSVVVELRIGNQQRASGFACQRTGLVLTTDYAVEDVEGSVEARFTNGTSHVAEVLKRDSNYGLALLQLPIQGISALDVGSLSPSLFSDVFTLGHKENVGWITGSGRITGKRLSPNGRSQLQAQLKISLGFGGAPVIDLHGQFVGLIHSTVRDEDTTFLVPAECCKAFLDDIVAH